MRSSARSPVCGQWSVLNASRQALRNWISSRSFAASALPPLAGVVVDVVGDRLDGPQPLPEGQQLAERPRGRGEERHAVAELQVVVERPQVRVQPAVGAGLADHQHHAVRGDLHLVRPQQRRDLLVAVALGRLEHRPQPRAQLVPGLVVVEVLTEALQLRVEVLDVPEVEPAVPLVEIPRVRGQRLQDLGLQRRQIPPRRRQVVGQFAGGEAGDGVRDVRQRRDHQQLRRVGRQVGAQFIRPPLGDRPAVVGHVVPDCVLQLAVDELQFRGDLRVVEVEVVRGDEHPLRGGPRLPQPGGHDASEADHGAGLLEPLVLPEAGIEVLQARVERVALGDGAGERGRILVGELRLAGLLEGFGVGLADRPAVVLPRQRLEHPLAEDVVELVPPQPDRLQPHRVPVRLRLQVAQHALDVPAGVRVGGPGEVGQHQAGVRGQPPLHRPDEVRHGGDRHPREVRVADLRGVGVVDVGRQLVDQDERRLVAQQVPPGRRPGGLQRRVVVGQNLASAQPLRDHAPEAERAVPLGVPAGEGNHPHRRQVGGGADFLRNFAPQVGPARQQPERDEAVRLPPAHGLPQEEHPLVAGPREAPEPLPQQHPHGVGDVVLREELLAGVAAPARGAGPQQRRQVGEVEDRVPLPGVEGRRPRRAEFFERGHVGRSLRPSLASTNVTARGGHRVRVGRPGRAEAPVRWNCAGGGDRTG